MIKDRLEVLRKQKPWKDAYYYQKAETLYQMTYRFCQRFLSQHGDRTVDQMIQAARSGKQNIIEGTEDGVTSTEIQLKLLNVARSSLQELRADYMDYLESRRLTVWGNTHERYATMQMFCRKHNIVDDYRPYFERWNDEEMANIAITLCYMTDTLLNNELKRLEQEFIEQGGIKERMHSARTGYRHQQDEELQSLRNKVASQKAEIARLKELLSKHGIKDL
ncbi:MAG: four helix bundle suffix domain-containing protein [Muribaculaceae bacterium]|nr:four helix bundle suffix domain-containing protein [Muribaculaceae bacterium]